MVSPQARRIYEYLILKLRGRWDGRQCIADLRRQDYNWRQMEWIGWYFEQSARSLLTGHCGGGIGPTYGNVTFDYQCDGVWDFKAHPTNQTSRWIYLNDVEAVNACVREENHLGWVIAHGPAEYDTSGEFKAWHDAIKGNRSAYEVARIARGAPSRRRKSAFTMEGLAIVEFRSIAELESAVIAGWLRIDMQQRQRNADGGTRRRKYGIDLARWQQQGA